MINNSKLSKVMLLTGALVFASFYSVSVNAAGWTEEDSIAYENSGSDASGAPKGSQEWSLGGGSATSAPAASGATSASSTSGSSSSSQSAQESAKLKNATTAAQNSSEAQVKYYEAEQKYKQAQKEYNEGVAKQQKEVQRQKAICDEDPSKCGDYDEARKELTRIQNDKTALNNAREAVNTANKNVKSTSNAASSAIYKAQKEANSELKNANKDIDKYCGDGKKADAGKCAEARKNKQIAEGKLKTANEAEAKSTGQKALTDKAIAERDARVEKNKEDIAKINKKIEALDKSDPSYARKKAALEAEKKEKETYNKGVAQARIKEACENPASKACQEAKGDKTDLASNMAQKQNDYNKAKDAYTAAAEDLAKTNAACAKGDPAACAQKKAKEQALEDARRKADDAYQDKVGAERAASGAGEYDKAVAQKKVEAQEALAKAQKAETEACKDPTSEACKKAKEATAAAQKIAEDPVKAAEDKLAAAQKAEEAACKDPASEACTKAKAETAKAQQEMSPLNKAKAADAQDEVAQAKKIVEDKTAAYNSLKAQLAEAQQACEYSSKLTSKAGKADAEKYCAQAAELEQQVAFAEEDLITAERAQAEAEAIANKLGGEGLDHSGQVYQAFSTNKGAVDTDRGIFTGQYIGSGDFSNSSDIFKTMTKRAMRILVGLKPIVYTFAGFGLIGFAFMAIFNKISWKWFSNIAIGLFLVANMGRFIEYFVYEGDQSTPQKLAFGDYLHAGYADTEYVWVDEISAYMPPKAIGEEEIPDVGIEVPETKTNARGFCQAEKKGGGLFGGGGFMSCVKDLVAAGKKAVDTAKKVQNTVNTVKSTVQQVGAAAQNIGDAAKMIGKGNLEDTFNALGKIGQNVNAMVGASGGMVNGIMSNVSAITNNVQDITKSRDEVAELNEKRARGEATNKIDAALKGQKIDADGNVERLWGGLDKNGNQKEGKIAGNSNILTGIQDTTKDVVSKGRELNGQYQDAVSTAGNLVGAVGNFNIGTPGAKTINQKLQEKRTAKQQAKNQAAAQQAAAENAAKRTAQQEVAAGREAANKPTPVVSSQTEYTSAVQKAQSAEQTARNKESTANNAQKDAAAKQQAADKLNEAARAAQEKAAKTGSVEDKRAAELAAQRANIAKAQADAAKARADSTKAAAEEARKQASDAKQKADSMRGNAVSEGIDKAKETQDRASKVIQEADKVIQENKAGLAEKQEAAKKAADALQEAVKKAQASGSEEDYREVGRLQNQKKQAETELKNAQQTIAQQEAAKAAAERAANEAKVKQAQLEAEEKAGLTQEKNRQMETADQQAERLRQEYARDNTASAQAKAAETKAGQAQTAAENAQIAAEAKELAAQRAATAAAQAAAQAKITGSAEDQRAAELAQKRAELAAAEAEAAKEVVKERREEAQNMSRASNAASLNEAQYLQSYYEQEMAAAETAISGARSALNLAQNEVKDAQEEVNRAVDQAKLYNDTETVNAAKAAADKLAQKQKELLAAQRELENQIKRRNSAQKSYYDAQEREAELRKQG